MKRTKRQLALGSLQPLLFCFGMYCVVLIFALFICSSIYNTIKTRKTAPVEVKAEMAQRPEKPVASL